MDNHEFKRAIALELIFAWEDSSEEVKKALERVMLNVGIDKHVDHWSLDLGSGRNLFLKDVK